MRNWQAVLEEFATAKEPMTWELPLIRIKPDEKWEAVVYLLEKGLIQRAGYLRDEHTDATYTVTETGHWMWEVGFTDLQRRARPSGPRKVSEEPTLAQRTVAIAHRSVFDLARLPWTFNLRAE